MAHRRRTGLGCYANLTELLRIGQSTALCVSSRGDSVLCAACHLQFIRMTRYESGATGDERVCNLELEYAGDMRAVKGRKKWIDGHERRVKVKIQVIIESDDGRVQDVEEVACLKRGTLTPEELGLNLAEAKEILQSVQRSMTEHQVGDYTAERINCPCCGQRRVQKGHHPILFRTLFGKLTLSSLRLHHCDCQPTTGKTFSLLAELLSERTAPELLYLEAKWCTLLSFGMTFDLLQEVLPMGEDLNVTTLRNNLHKVAVRMEAELGDECQHFMESGPQSVPMNSMPEPQPPLAVALDGAYVHAAGNVERKERWFEVVVGKSITAANEGKYLGFVLNYDEKPKRRLYESLRSQGLELGQPVTFFSDGEDTLRQLQMYVSPLSEHILDWFHITMKLTVINQMRKSLVGAEPAAWLGEVEKNLESLKWHLWNGNVDQALRLIDGLKAILDGEQISPERQNCCARFANSATTSPPIRPTSPITAIAIAMANESAPLLPSRSEEHTSELQ